MNAMKTTLRMAIAIGLGVSLGVVPADAHIIECKKAEYINDEFMYREKVPAEIVEFEGQRVINIDGMSLSMTDFTYTHDGLGVSVKMDDDEINILHKTYTIYDLYTCKNIE